MRENHKVFDEPELRRWFIVTHAVGGEDGGREPHSRLDYHPPRATREEAERLARDAAEAEALKWDNDHRVVASLYSVGNEQHPITWQDPVFQTTIRGAKEQD